ncbi:MAG: hypothetical protein ACRD0V_02010 [Acidimicrobiales bacterium]
MPDPNVGDLLPAKLDELVAKAANLLEEIRAVTEQLHPERARSCRNAITMASVMVDEIRLRAHDPTARRARTVTRLVFRWLRLVGDVNRGTSREDEIGSGLAAGVASSAATLVAQLLGE